jgi:glycogen synthase
LQRAAQFSWQKSAQAYHDLFERVLLEESHR